MAYEMLVGLDVHDNESYQRYREGMTPILTAYNGGFGYDLTVERLLKNPSGHKINRMFTIYFPTRKDSERFFTDETYLAVRAEHFEPAVASTTIMAAYERPD